MPRTNLWGQSVLRVELDQRSRETRRRLERLELLFVPRAAERNSRVRRFLALRAHADQRSESRITRASSGMPTFIEIWPLKVLSQTLGEGGR
jgi:hypothetical protein